MVDLTPRFKGTICLLLSLLMQNGLGEASGFRRAELESSSLRWVTRDLAFRVSHPFSPFSADFLCPFGRENGCSLELGAAGEWKTAAEAAAPTVAASICR